MNNILKINVDAVKNDLVENFQNGTLIDYVSNEVLEVKKDTEGNLEYLVFSLGGPQIQLDMGVEDSGCVYGYMGLSKEYKKPIPLSDNIWFDMKSELEEIFSKTDF